MPGMGIKYMPRTWDQWTEWAARTSKQLKNPNHIVPRMCLGVAVYNLWKERNARSFGENDRTKESLSTSLCSQMAAQVHIKWKTDPNVFTFGHLED